LIRRLLNEQRGYSLVEVMASIMILTIAIIPMVGMFDMGLNTAGMGNKYDKARTLANTKLEQAKMLDYETVRTDFPSQAASGKGAPGATGSVTSSSVTSAQDPRVPPGFSYVVTKQYLQQPPTGIEADPGEEVEFDPSASVNDTALLKVTVRVSWSGNSYQTSGVVAG
jgi:prepilin-type N-terminal cleavage/methylation domain-containing protein